MCHGTHELTFCSCLLVGACCSWSWAQIDFGEPKEITTIEGIVWSPSVSPNGHELYYTRWLGSGGQWDIHWASRESITSPWADQGPVPSILSDEREDNVTLTPDGLSMIYGSTRSGGLGSYDLWMAQRPEISAPWQAPVNLQAINTNEAEGAPSLSLDGLSLYFGAGWGTWDGVLKVSTRPALTGDWSEPMVVPGFEDVEQANYPAISHDGLSLVYSKGTNLDLDLWVATRATTIDPFGNHTPLSDVINTDNIDFSPHLTQDGTLYYTRGAIQGEENGWDLYQTGPELIFDPLDFSLDAKVDLADLDSLCSGVYRGRFRSEYDLTEDGVVDLLDVTSFLQNFGSFQGDVDLDGDVDFSDFAAFSDRFGRTTRGAWSLGDFDCDGLVGFRDFLLLSSNFGSGVAEEISAGQSVPEPTCGWFGYLLCIILLRRRSPLRADCQRKLGSGRSRLRSPAKNRYDSVAPASRPGGQCCSRRCRLLVEHNSAGGRHENSETPTLHHPIARRGD